MTEVAAKCGWRSGKMSPKIAPQAAHIYVQLRAAVMNTHGNGIPAIWPPSRGKYTYPLHHCLQVASTTNTTNIRLCAGTLKLSF